MTPQNQYMRARELGAAARRAGKRKDENPYHHQHTDGGRANAWSWDHGWQAEDDARRKAQK